MSEPSGVVGPLQSVPSRAQMEAQDLEWRAWRSVCKELKAMLVVEAGWSLPVDLNTPEFDPLMNAIRRWGEELVGLRDVMPEFKAKALNEARQQYATLVDE